MVNVLPQNLHLGVEQRIGRLTCFNFGNQRFARRVFYVGLVEKRIIVDRSAQLRIKNLFFDGGVYR